uniref:Transcription factor TFIIIC triple barrel domain-containing protein n=1 Tax=Opuntia streptacantha TaxID=393608 RepID=A0A7C8YIX2_OPUST
METYTTNSNQKLEKEEYVLLDLDAVCGQVDIPPDEPYVLSMVKMQGLDTLNPILSIGNNLKLIGEYEETIGTCLIFSENEMPPSVCEGSGSSEANISKGTLETDHKQNPSKLIKPVTSLQKILKFRLLPEVDEQDLRGKPPDAPSQKEHL